MCKGEKRGVKGVKGGVIDIFKGSRGSRADRSMYDSILKSLDLQFYDICPVSNQVPQSSKRWHKGEKRGMKGVRRE